MVDLTTEANTGENGDDVQDHQQPCWHRLITLSSFPKPFYKRPQHHSISNEQKYTTQTREIISSHRHIHLKPAPRHTHLGGHLDQSTDGQLLKHSMPVNNF